MPVACSKHPQSKVWESSSGPRCYICGDVLVPKIAVTAREPMRVHHLDTFQRLSQRTSVAWQNGLVLTPEQAHLLHAAMGLAGESCEFVEHIKKHLFQGHPLDKAKLREECGDIMWYVADAAKALDALLSDVASENEAKLQKRYPDGFSTEASVARVDTKDTSP